MQYSNVTLIEEDVAIPSLLESSLVNNWLNALAISHGSIIKDLSYTFCSDEFLLYINITHLGHDFYTDIITFPYLQGKTISSEIFISVDRVLENAQEYNVSFENELLRVISHGLLHLIGFGDKDEEAASTMRSQEESSIALYYTLI